MYSFNHLCFCEMYPCLFSITLQFLFGSGLILLKMLSEYVDISKCLPSLSFEVVQRVVEILKHFNTRTCQLVLGAGAMQVSLFTIGNNNSSLFKYVNRARNLLLAFSHNLPFNADCFNKSLNKYMSLLRTTSWSGGGAVGA